MTKTAKASGTRWVLFPVLLAGVSACSLLQSSPALDVKPAQSGFTAALLPDEVEYNAAVHAISVRDYGAALDYLQVARQKKPDDIRVLNGFGVVYDKLGRFDLSARYYAQAQKLDPKSTIVSANLAYSARLQERRSSGLPSEIAIAPISPAAADTRGMQMAPLERAIDSTPSLVAAPVIEPRVFLGWTAPPRFADTASNPASSAVLHSAATAVAPVPAAGVAAVKAALSHPDAAAKKPVLTGHPLAIINASGQRGASEAVRRQLASRGWTSPRSAMSDGPQQSVTMINFASSNSTAAHALAHTLPFPSRLVTCKSECAGLRLVLGRDFLKTHAAKPVSSAVKRS